MKKLFLIITILSLHASSAFSAIPDISNNDKLSSELLNDSKPAVSEKNMKKDKPKVEIFNFHQTRRCATCLAIEKSLTKVINEHFQKEIKEGKVKLNILNVEDRNNSNYVNKFKAYGLALFIVVENNGKENIINLTAEGVRHARRNPEQFEQTLRTRIIDNLN